MKIEDFEQTSPPFSPEEFFSGRLEGWGVIESPLGGLQKRYTVQAEGRLDPGGAIQFTETWTFDDGHVDTLTWMIVREASGAYRGTEPRLEGEAEGEVAGCAFHWTYVRDTPQPDGKSVKLKFDDWFWRIDEHVVIVKGSAGRLGLPFATAHVTYRKLV